MRRVLPPPVITALLVVASTGLVRLAMLIWVSWRGAEPAIFVLGMPPKAFSALLLAIVLTTLTVGVAVGFRRGFFGGCDE